MGKLWHEDGYPQIEPGNPIVRTRTFEANDVVLGRTEEEMKERIAELAAKRETFDPNTQFTGLRRLGSSYTVAEPFAYFDGPTPDQRKLNYALLYLGVGVTTVLSVLMGNKLRRGSYARGLTLGLLSAPPVAWLSGKWYDWHVNNYRKKNNILLHYALMKENQLPVIERKKYGEIIKDWTPHRSLHILGEGNFKWF